MSPRPGGEADKFGNRYEGAWTVRHALYVLVGQGDSITVEEVDDLGAGSEFTFRNGSVVEVHQVKRQNGNANSWTVKSLAEKHIFRNARAHVDAGREFHFVSTVPARPLQELADRARRSSDLSVFIDKWLTKDIKSDFDHLASSEVLGSTRTAWTVLRGIWVDCPDERDVAKVNATLAELHLSGAIGNLAAIGLGDLIVQNLGVRLDADAIVSRLGQYGLARVELVRSSAMAEKVSLVTSSWIDSIQRELLQPVIARPEAEELTRLLRGDEKLVLLQGAAGDGKSAVLYEATQSLQADGCAVLAFRLDRLESFSSTKELGIRLGLDVSPVTGLAAIASDRRAILIVDQLDAVSLASGRMPRNFDAIADLVREASAFPSMRVLVACRKFDVENDHRIRDLIKGRRSAKVEVSSLTDEQIIDAVDRMGLDASTLTAYQKKLLRSPLHLVLLSGIAEDVGALSFSTTKNLFDAFWRRKNFECSERRTGVRFAQVVTALADAISAHQRLAVSDSVLDAGNLAVDASVLVSEHVLTQDGSQIAFFHESFFDYAFARGWLNRRQTLVEFLSHGEQELFRRAQVRQILNHLRESDLDRFVAEVRELLLSSSVRFHLKDVVLRILSALSDPTAAEWALIEELLDSPTAFDDRLWLSLRTLPWFDRIDSEGAIEDWLAETPASQRTENAITIMGAASKGRSDRIAELLAPHVDHEAFAGWLQWIVRFADLHSSRALFDLLLSTVKSGRYEQAGREMWYSVHELGKHEPGWVVELLATYLVDRPGAMAMDSRQKLDVLSDRDHSMIESVQIAAEGAHELFCIRFLGYILAVISVTAYPSDGERPITDRHFSFRHPGSDPHELDVALLQGVRTALRVLTEQDLPNARPILEFLAENPHDAAQWLLYEALQVAGEELGEWAATLLLEGKYRFLCGYSANNVWTTRQLLQAITPHITNDAFRKLEAEIIGLRFSWESRPGGGYYEFCLLSGFDSSRLSEAARRRLGELRRLHKMDDPLEPKGVTGGFIGSPIPQESARHMTDAHWTRAIAKHAGNRTDWSTLTGSAEELAHVLKAETIRDPFRFARFATSLTADVHPAYPNAILLGFADAEALTDAEPIFDAVRYIASLHIESSDRWLGHSLRKYIKSGVPDDLFALVADRALNATDPTGNDLPVRSNRENGRAVDLYTSGINVARGDAAETLGDMLIFDTDGVRTALIAPLLNRIASDQSMAVRSCVAHVIAACLRHAKSQAVDAFGHLIQGDDLLLATHPVEKLIIFIGNVDQDVVEPVIRRMLASSEFEVRETGGQLAAFAGLEWAADDLFNLVLDSDDMAARKGAAGVCAHRLPRTNNAILAGSALERFFSDAHEEVRKAAAEVASALRGERLRPFRHVIKNVMGSPAFPEAVPQLLITLERASDRVDDLVLECADRFIETYESEVGDFRGRAAGDSRQIGELLLRAYVQATPVATRRRVLDLLDRLLLIDAYGLAELVGAAER